MGKPESKKPNGTAPAEHAPKTAPAPSAPAKGNVGAKVGCAASGCKGKDQRYNFCDEHFRQFKFGLITKSGDPVSDYEKKFEHYQHWLKSQKVA